MDRCNICNEELVISPLGQWECINTGCPRGTETIAAATGRGGLLSLPSVCSGVALVSLLRGDVGRFQVGSQLVVGVALEDVASGNQGRFTPCYEE